MLYGFVTDIALWNRQLSNGIVTPLDNITNGVGFIDDTMMNYFVEQYIIRDPRSLQGATNNRLSIVGGKGLGQIKLHFDHEYNTYVFDSVTQEVFNQLFNLIEAAYLTQNATSASLNTLFTGNGITYGAYVPGSLEISQDTTESTIDLITGSTVEVNIRKWIYFKYTLAGNALPVEFKLWLDEEAFMHDYPISTIVKPIVYAADIAKFLNPDFVNIVNAMTNGGATTINLAAQAMSIDDHTGMELYYSKYITSASATQEPMPFGVPYKGAVPTSDALREAIRDDLVDSGLASYNEWKEVFPDLFVDGSFFLVPFYDNTYVNGGVTLDQDILKIYTGMGKVSALFPDENSASLYQKLEALNSSATGIPIMAFASENNDSGARSLQAVHPTYMAIDGTNALFDLMEPVTQEFSQHLSHVLAILLGKEVQDPSDPYYETRYGTNKFLSFVDGYLEYHVLKPESYLV